jgi:fermentation-respiration switch protein FrsA (DUF1100 family)
MGITILIGFILAYVIALFFVFIFQNKMVYFPTRELYRTPNSIGLDYDEVRLITADGLNLSAWYIPANSARGTVLFCHGNAGNISHRLDSIRIFHTLGLDVLIFDYRGYGQSDGNPSEKGTYLDAQSALDYLVQIRDIPPHKIILFGRSLGGAVAAEIALRNNAGALIVESAFTSVPDLGTRYFPFFPVRYISRFHYSTIDKVDKICIPKLFIHSRDDDLIPYHHGKALYEKAALPKAFLEIQGDHNEGFLLSGDVYIEGLDNFLSKYY